MVTEVHTSTLLEIKNMYVDYVSSKGTVHAVNNVSFTLERGEILGLAGESGCGKSTLAYGLTRLLRPPAVITGGEVLYYPRDEESVSPDAAKSARRARQTAFKEAVDVLSLTP